MSTWQDLVDQFSAQWVADVAAGVYPDEALVPVTGDPLGWGRDLVCLSDITSNAEEYAADDPLGVVHAILRRINTGHGQLPDDDDPDAYDYGIGDAGVIGFLNRGFGPTDWDDLAVQIATEIGKDDRVDKVTVKCVGTIVGGSETLSIDIQGVIVAPSATIPFSMTAAATSGDQLAQLLHVQLQQAA